MLSQIKFTKELLKACSDLDISFKVVTPLPINIKLSADMGGLFEDPALYRSLMGKLNYLTHTRPDLSYTV